MKIIRLALLSAATLIGSLVVSAQQPTAEAFVSSVTGSATYMAAGSTTATPLVAGQTLPEGATVTTGAGATVMIQSHEGIETGVGANTTVVVGEHSVSSEGLRTAVIDLKSGTSVSVLDPTKRAVNNYAVRTPKGVAAARGTVYSTTVKLSSGGEATVTVNTVTGAVSFAITPAGGGVAKTVIISEGNSANSNTGVSTSIANAISEATGSDKTDIAEALNATVKVASVAAQVNEGKDGGAASTTLDTVVKNITEAANQVATTKSSDSALAGSIVADTVTTVRELAGTAASDKAVAVIKASATGDNATQATTASEKVVVPVVISKTVDPKTTQTAPIVVPPTSTSKTTTDLTIIVSPSTTQ